MARVAALVPALLFGPKAHAALPQAGHDRRLLSAPPASWPPDAEIDVLVVDLTTDAIDGAAIVSAARADGRLAATKVLGFFAHVEPEVRERALAAGFDQVVPRSRMNREGAELVSALAGGLWGPGRSRRRRSPAATDADRPCPRSPSALTSTTDLE